MQNPKRTLIEAAAKSTAEPKIIDAARSTNARFRCLGDILRDENSSYCNDMVNQQTRE